MVLLPLERDCACTSLNFHTSRKNTVLVLEWFLCKKCGLWEQWNSDIAVSLTLAKLSNIQSDNTGLETLLCTPLTTIHIDLPDSSLLTLLFLKSLIFLSCCPTVNIGSCSWVIVSCTHCISSKYWVSLLHTSYSYQSDSFNNISDMDKGGSGCRQVRNWLGF